MSYAPPKHFAVVNRSTLVSDRDVAYWTEACRVQLQRDVCPLWNLSPPGAALYPADEAFPDDTALMAAFVDDIWDPGVLGEHGVIGTWPFVLIDARLSRDPSTVLSHEFIEATINVNLDRWTPVIQRHGHACRYPLEAADPVESSGYGITVSMLDGARTIDVSNFVFPAWFNPQSIDPVDFLGKLMAPFEIEPGGYAAPEIDGEVTYIGEGQMNLTARKFMPWGRQMRLMRGHGKR